MDSHNYKEFAKEYSQLDIKDTFYLGFRDLPKLIDKYAKGKKALDFGCGSGRSTRFLKKLGLATIGVDINQEMLDESKKLDSEGDYYLIENKVMPFNNASFDIILLFAVLMEVPSKEKIKEILHELNRILKREGVIIIVTDAEDMYKHDCASFIYSYPENKEVKSGMKVKIRFRGTNIIFYDYYWTEKDYQEVFSETGFRIEELRKPLATGNEPVEWNSETKHPHFAIYVLKKTEKTKSVDGC